MPLIPKTGTKGNPSAVPPTFTQYVLCTLMPFYRWAAVHVSMAAPGRTKRFSPGAFSADEAPLFAEVGALFSPSLRCCVKSLYHTLRKNARGFQFTSANRV